jgi:NAD(P)-dependent dehydrogenase (short-subunit alcohol dehydrogenase family)
MTPPESAAASWEAWMSSGGSNPNGRPVAVVVGATSKWQAGGANTRLVRGGAAVDDAEVPVSARWGAGGAIAQKFAREGFFVVMTTRARANAEGLAQAIAEAGGEGMIVELDLASPASIAGAFEAIRRDAGDPEVLVYNAGYLEGRQLPPEQELLEHFPPAMFETAIDVACRGPFLVAKEVLPAMRLKGRGSILFSNNPQSLRGRKRRTGASLYYPRVMVRALAQVLTEEYTEHGVHVANVIIDGVIDAPGVRGVYGSAPLMDPARIADAFFWLHTQDPCCWTHELQLTPAPHPPTV